MRLEGPLEVICSNPLLKQDTYSSLPGTVSRQLLKISFFLQVSSPSKNKNNNAAADIQKQQLLDLSTIKKIKNNLFDIQSRGSFCSVKIRSCVQFQLQFLQLVFRYWDHQNQWPLFKVWTINPKCFTLRSSNAQVRFSQRDMDITRLRDDFVTFVCCYAECIT